MGLSTLELSAVLFWKDRASSEVARLWPPLSRDMNIGSA